MPERANGTQQADGGFAPGVSSYFLSDFFAALERQGIPVVDLVGDLPLPEPPNSKASGRADWDDFATFMQRLEDHVGGADGLVGLGDLIGELKPAQALGRLAGLAASPRTLFEAAVRFGLRRALPGIRARVEHVANNRIEIHAALEPGLRGCPQIFHFALGGARALPGILGLPAAAVHAEIQDDRAHYELALPPSPTLWARGRRALYTLFSSGSVLKFLETQQLELHTQHVALQKAHEDLAESETRFRALFDAAVDVLWEVDRAGRIVYASASVRELLGYSPQQVIGSHYHLWIPKKHHGRVDATFTAAASEPPGFALKHELMTFHGNGGRRIVAEMSVRTYLGPRDQWRMVCILRDVSGRREDRTEPFEVAHAEGWSERESPADQPLDLIVGEALILAEAKQSPPRWIETAKLVECVATKATLDEAPPALGWQTPSTPSAVHCRPELLALGLEALFDVARSMRPGSIDLTLEVQASPQAGGTLDFIVSDAGSAGTGHAPMPAGDPEEARLARAHDVARSHDGQVVFTDDPASAEIVRMSIRQPRFDAV